MSLQPNTQFRRSGQRDDRRRRLFAEEPAVPARRRRRRGEASPADRKSDHYYPETDFMAESPRLVDLVPRRLSSLLFWLGAGLVAVAGLEVLYSYVQSPSWRALTTDGTIAAFDLDGEGSLAVWFSSATLALAALTAVVVYTVRRHKTDDYRGYYRVWLWAAACCLLMSIDETSSLHEGFKEMMAHATGNRLYGDGSVWWVIPYFFLLGAVGSRLLVDMWSCRLSSGALLAAAGCYAVAVVTQLGWLLPESGARGVMLEEGAEMVGNLLLLTAMGLHARYVILDAEGLLPRREPKPQKSLPEDRQLEEDLARDAEQDEEEPADEQWIAVDSAHESLSPVRKRRLVEAQREPESDAEDEAEPEPVSTTVGRKLTKAEKKALRKRLQRERLKRQQSQGNKW